MEKIFIDTDIGFDCDDVGALSILNLFKNKGLCEILGMTHSTKFNKTGVKTIKAVNDFFHNGDIKVGFCDSCQNLCGQVRVHEYNDELIRRFYKDNGINDLFYSSTDLLLKTLLNEEDKSVTYVSIGMLTNLASAYSYKDEFLDGEEILNKKLKEIVIMGGNFNSKISEFNIKSDIYSSQVVLEKASTNIYFLDFNVGVNIKTGGKLINENNPIGIAYSLFSKGDRESWDPLTVLFALKHDDDLFTISKEGTVRIDKNGFTAFDDSTLSKHYLINLNKDKEIVENRINDYMEEKI